MRIRILFLSSGTILLPVFLFYSKFTMKRIKESKKRKKIGERIEFEAQK